MKAPEARYFKSADGRLECSLCPRRCSIAPGNYGACKVRGNNGGRPALPFYGHISAIAGDPIEKKPLYHFRPGTAIFSAGFLGCNLRCPFCQNWRISQKTGAPSSLYSPKDLVRAAAASGHEAIAYTYSEALVHAEYLLECMELARARGIANVLVTNGSVNAEPARDILSLASAANIDLKCFSARAYKDILGGNLDAVQTFIETALSLGVRTEITTLVVPGLSGTSEETGAMIDYLAALDPALPWHVSAYHPDYKYHEEAPKSGVILDLVRAGREKLSYVYAGNLGGVENDTRCPHCGKTLVKRRDYSVAAGGLLLREEAGRKAYFCASCKERAPVYW